MLLPKKMRTHTCTIPNMLKSNETFSNCTLQLGHLKSCCLSPWWCAYTWSCSRFFSFRCNDFEFSSESGFKCLLGVCFLKGSPAGWWVGGSKERRVEVFAREKWWKRSHLRISWLTPPTYRFKWTLENTNANHRMNSQGAHTALKKHTRHSDKLAYTSYLQI